MLQRHVVVAKVHSWYFQFYANIFKYASFFKEIYLQQIEAAINLPHQLLILVL
jgi:hypothetical protein